MGAIVIRNLGQVLGGLSAFEQRVEKAAEYGITVAALAIERQAKLNANTGVHPRGQGHIPGTGPGPNVVTGTLRRSITTEVRYGFGTYVASVGPTVEYARAVELGNPRWKSGVRYPFLIPAVGYLVGNGTLNRVFTNAFKSRMKTVGG
jgi:hypothetical protein